MMQMMGRGFVRRRPLLRAAAVGGTFAAGRAMGRRAEQRDYAESSQDQRISDLEGNQAPQQYQDAPPAQSAAPGGSPMLDQLNQLTALHQQGALSDEEFASAKAKILAG
jgi:hypothetical protein